MTPLITLPNDFVANISTSASGLFSSLSPLVTLILGVLLAVFAIGAIISWVKH